MEEWKWVEGFEAIYEISNYGHVRSHITSRGTVRAAPLILKLYKINTGYPAIVLTKGGRRYRVLVHRLVATAFVANPRNVPCVNHKDSRRDNPRWSNLEWVTRSENQKHAYQFGRLDVPRLRGEECPSSVLTERQVREIRSLYRRGSLDASQRVLARKYRVDQDTINSIVNAKTWRHLL